MNLLIWVILAMLFVVAIVDFKEKKVPSIVLTAMIFLTAFVNHDNLWFGFIGFIMAYMLYESDFFGGVADVKVMTAIAFMVSSFNGFFYLLILTMLVGISWKGAWYLYFKTNKKKIPKEFPFLPVFFIVFIIMILLGVFSW